MTLDTILQAIGNTPIVKLQSVGSDLPCNLFAKCEFLNPGGSVKDRIAYHMVIKAEEEGRIKPGDTLIEPTSGNTGIGLAMVGVLKGYKVVITMPEKMSHEKQTVLKALGAKIYCTPSELPSDHPDSHMSLARRLQKELPNAHILDQYGNPNNPDAHYQFTAQEIIDTMDCTIDMAVMGVGTGGTITGIGKRLKEHNPNIQIIGVDPIGSILGGGDEVKPYLVEGIGYDFIPDVLNNQLVDRYIKIDDQHAFQIARRLIREEALLVGGSSGAATWGALQAARNLTAQQNCLIILPDSIRNYLTRFVDDAWMQAHHF